MEHTSVLPDIEPRRPYSLTDSRTLKRTHAEANLNPSELSSAGGEYYPPRTRGPSACEKCRARKTRCDNIRPSCSYCRKHEIPCIYADDSPSSPWSSSVTQILDAIGNLTKLVERQQHQSRHDNDHQNNGADAHPSFQSVPSQTRLPSQGVEAILQWKILAPYKTSSVMFADDTDSLAVSTHSVPNIEYQELSRLESRYIFGVHLKNPILDLPDLRQKVLHIAENGLDWTTRTCLVALVCAIGAVTQEYQDQPQSPEYSLSPRTPLPVFRSGSEPELSMQFWSLAAKRLGFAVGQNDVEAVQCLCLAAIWCMHHLQPLQAWKYFNLAGTAWYLVNLTHQRTNELLDEDSQKRTKTLMQTLYFTIWKSECELRLELDIAGSILENLDVPDAFPRPPNLSERSRDPEIGHTERAWYYYLAEIAIRHLMNHLLRTHFWMTDECSERDIRAMVAQADVAEGQLRDWYSTLPPIFRFDIPTGDILPTHPDDLTQILRNRFLACRELICRPFVRLCVTSSLNIDPLLGNRVVQLANQGLQHSILKLSQVLPHFHQGIWFALRNVLTSSLMLIAVHKAQSDPDLSLAQALVIPQDWRRLISRPFQMLAAHWDVRGSGGLEMRRVLQTALDDLDQV